MQTPVRFYITQDDEKDQPVVRTVPVARHPVPRVASYAAADGQRPDSADPGKVAVAKLVRRAVRRPLGAK